MQGALRRCMLGGAGALLLALAAISRSRSPRAVALVGGGGVGGSRRAGRPMVRARQTMLRGLGAGPEDDSRQDWEVGMHLDYGCQKQLTLRKEGNLAWKRIPEREPCIPNKKLNPMMWPFDAPGKAWVKEGERPEEEGAAEPLSGHDVEKQENDTYKDMPHFVLPSDSKRVAKQWPYNHKNLHNFVQAAEVTHPTIDWTDGVIHGNPAEEESDDVVDNAAQPEGATK